MTEDIAQLIGGIFYGSIIGGYILWFWNRVR